MKYSLLSGILFLFSFSISYAQKYTISGYIKDGISGESLFGTAIYSEDGKAGTTSNNFGFYSITLPVGEISLIYSFPSYELQKLNISLNKDTIINISLSGTLLDQVVVKSKGKEQERTQTSSVNIPIHQINSLPTFLGEVDLMKVLQLTPGVQSGGEGSSGLYVRGGGPDQNLILLDGVPVYNASHLFGFFSVFNSDAINNMELFKGGFPARYGGRISSVIDINMKEGNMQKFSAQGSLGLVAARLTLEGPIVKNKTSFIVSARRTYIDLLSKPFMHLLNSDEENFYLGYYFYDLTAKINHKFSDRDRVFLSAYLGSDNFYLEQKFTPAYPDSYRSEDRSNIKWGNLTTALRWNHIFTAKLFGNIAFTYSKFKFNTGINSKAEDSYVDRSSYYNVQYNSGIEDIAAKMNFDYLPSPNHYVRFGLNAINHSFSPGAIGVKASELSDTLMGASSLRSQEYSAYLEDDWKLNSIFKINPGVHWSGFNVNGKFYQNLQLRMSARLMLTRQMSLKAAYSQMAQYIHLLSNSGISLPNDLWVPSTKLLRPQTSDQWVVGLVNNFDEKYELSAEVYYKSMKNVTEYKAGASFFDIDKQWENKILQGDGRSFGLELFAQKKTGKLTGWIGYTLSKTDRVFDELNNGKRFDYKYDRRHDISVVSIYRPNKRIELAATWVFGTGSAITVPIALMEGLSEIHSPNESLKIYSDKNAYRMASYHRLDLSISFIKTRKNWERRWIFGVYNAYSRNNPFYIDLVTDSYYNWEGQLIEKHRFEQYSLFPIIPAISYRFKF